MRRQKYALSSATHRTSRERRATKGVACAFDAAREERTRCGPAVVVIAGHPMCAWHRDKLRTVEAEALFGPRAARQFATAVPPRP